MAKIDFNVEFPSVFGAAQRPVTEVSLDDLKDLGVAFANYGMNPGDIVVFPSREDLKVLTQKTNLSEASTAKQALIRVFRGTSMEDLQPGYLAAGSLCRVDINNKAVCPFSQKMYDLGNHKARIEACLGKTIKGVEFTPAKLQKWENGVALRDENKNPVLNEDGRLLIIEEVE